MRVNIVEEIERHVRLQKAGRSYKGLSPFTNEKSPSFHVNPEKGAFYCFSSSQGGDVIRFVEMVEHLPFNEAVEALAQRYNIALEYENGVGPDKTERSRRTALLDIHEQARAYFHQCFMAEDAMAEQVRQYWTEKRHFTLDVAKDFSIGFDPPGSNALAQKLLGAGFAPDILIESGIFVSRDDRPDSRDLRSRFRGRLIIPIREPSQGQVIAFTARELFCTPGAGSESFKLAKYVNSPGTPLFHKSRVLFNLERAQKPVRDEAGGFLLVEGQLDAIRCWSSGFQVAVAPQGTSITEEQLHILKRYSDRLRVVLDGDGAGQRAALRVLPMALAAGIEPTFVVLPSGQDPDSLLVEQGAEAMAGTIEAELEPMSFVARTFLADPDFSGPRGIAEAMKKANEILSSVDSEVARVEYLRRLCDLMHVDFAAAQADLFRFIMRSKQVTQARSGMESVVKEKPPERLTTLESDLWYMILQEEQLAFRLSEIIEDKWIDVNFVEGKLLGRLLWDLREGLVESVSGFMNALEEPDERNCMYALQVKSGTTLSEDPQRDAENILQRLFIKYRKSRLEEIDRLRASGVADSQEILHLLEERIQLLQTKKQLPCLSIQD